MMCMHIDLHMQWSAAIVAQSTYQLPGVQYGIEYKIRY